MAWPTKKPVEVVVAVANQEAMVVAEEDMTEVVTEQEVYIHLYSGPCEEGKCRCCRIRIP